MVLEEPVRQLAGPMVSICIPTYSRHKYLEEAITSAIAQGYSAVEILVSDDGCSPAVEAVANKFVERDPRVRYWRNQANLGLAGNWNKCVDEACGEYVIIMGDDDRLLPDGLRGLVTAGSEDLIFGSHLLINAQGRLLEERSRASNQWYGRGDLKAGPLENAERVVWKSSVPICGTIIRTALAKRFRFKEDTNTPEIILFAELAASGATFRYVDTMVAEYRIHDESATNSGLWNDKLAKYLVNISVSAQCEDRKMSLLRPVLVNAVNRCLSAGNFDQAREFARSKYYPNDLSNLRVAFQRACLSLPPKAGLQLFHLGKTLKKGSQGLAAAS